jgi:hypothetical protein
MDERITFSRWRCSPCRDNFKGCDIAPLESPSDDEELPPSGCKYAVDYARLLQHAGLFQGLAPARGGEAIQFAVGDANVKVIVEHFAAMARPRPAR